MKFITLAILLIVVTKDIAAQKENDNLIRIIVSDTSKLYERVRQAITFTDLIIRDDSKKDTLITYSERLDGTTVYIIAKVIIKGNIIEITGAYGLGSENFWGYPAWPKSYSRIVYFKGSESWRALRRIAIKLDSKIEFINVRE